MELEIATPSKLSVLVVDDHPVFRHGLVEILNRMHFVKSAEEAGNCDQAAQLLTRKRFDILLLDIVMPGKDGLDFLAELKNRRVLHKPRVIIISSHSEPSKIFSAYNHDVFGYILKDTPVKEIRRALLEVARGEPYFSETVRKTMLDQLVKRKVKTPSAVNLTQRELEVLDLVCRKKTNKEIAEILSRSIDTVKRHRNKLNEKVGVSNSAGLIIYAIENGLFKV